MFKVQERSARPAELALIDDLVTHYRGAHALMAAVTLGIFDALGGGPQTAGQVAQRIGAVERATAALLEALVALRFLEAGGGLYRNAPVAEQYLKRDSERSLASNLQYQQLLAEAWARLPQVVRTGRPALTLPQLLDEHPEFVERYIHGMAEISRVPAQELASRLDLADVRNVLDLGGGGGVYAQAVAERSPELRVVLMDVEPVLRIAEQRLGDWADRRQIELREGDYHTAEFGVEAFDLVLFSHVLHDEGESECKRLLQKAFHALVPGGQLIIHDFMPGSDGQHRLFPALFSLHMLVYTQKGRAYRADEYETWLRDAGFREPRRVAICADRPTSTTAIIARKPCVSIGSA